MSDVIPLAITVVLALVVALTHVSFGRSPMRRPDHRPRPE